MKKNKRILISKALPLNSILKEWCANHKFTLIDEPFITVSALPNIAIPKTDWIFFSSPSAVTCYFESYELKANKIGVYASGTERSLLTTPYKAHFVGIANRLPKEIGADFLEVLQPGETVFFPISNLSKKSIWSAVENARTCFFEVTYQTTPIKNRINSLLDAIIFTSPSNLTGFLRENKLSPMTTLIAIGETTAEAIYALNYTNEVFVSNEPTEAGLLAVLKAIYS